MRMCGTLNKHFQFKKTASPFQPPAQYTCGYMLGATAHKKSRDRLGSIRGKARTSSAPPLTRAAKLRQEKDSIKRLEMADLGAAVEPGPQKSPKQLPDDPQQLDVQEPDDPPKSAQKSSKKKRKGPKKTELRFQRLEGMMAQLLQHQKQPATPQTVAPTPGPWQTGTVRPPYGLPRPTLSTQPIYRTAETPYPRPQPNTLAAQLGHFQQAPPPPPEAILDNPAAAGTIADALRSLDPVFQATGGKTHTIVKPHMFIPRRFVNKKAVEKEDISFPLYMNGLAGMILNALPDQSTRAAALCRHLREAAEDAVDKPWPVVREWSKSVFDRMERGEITWDTYSEIQNDRLKLTLSWAPPERAIYPCALFQNRQCPEPDSHTEHAVTYRHVCAFCYYTASALRPHSFLKCTVKKPAHFQPRALSQPPAGRQARRQQADTTPKN